MMAGSAVVAKYSKIIISESAFEGNVAEIGGALFVENSIITIRRTIFSQNRVICGPEFFTNGTYDFFYYIYHCSNYLGGVLFTYQSDITIEGTKFSGNGAPNGGVVYSRDSNISIRMCSFFNNSANDDGGIFKSDSSNIIIIGSSFQYNEANGFGGVMYSQNDVVVLKNNNAFQNNIAQRGGILHTFESDVEISGSTFVDNVAIYKYWRSSELA